MRRLVSLIAAIACCGVASADSIGQSAKPAIQPGNRPTTFVIETRAKPWGAMFEWLTDQTGLPFVSKIPPPPGTFSFIAKAGQRYTLGELMDLINDGLAAHKYILLRGPTCIRLLPADERIDKNLVPYVRLEDLAERGQTELVEVVLPLRELPPDEFAIDVKKMMGPFGEVAVLRHGNRLLLQDTARNLRRIVAHTKELEESDTRTFIIGRHSSADLAEMLRRLVPEIRGNPVEIKTLVR